MPQLIAYLIGLFHQLAAALVTAWTWTFLEHWYLGLAAAAGALIAAAVLAPRTHL